MILAPYLRHASHSPEVKGAAIEGRELSIIATKRTSKKSSRVRKPRFDPVIPARETIISTEHCDVIAVGLLARLMVPNNVNKHVIEDFLKRRNVQKIIERGNFQQFKEMLMEELPHICAVLVR